MIGEFVTRFPGTTFFLKGVCVVGLSAFNVCVLLITPNEFKTNILGWKVDNDWRTFDQRIGRVTYFCDPFYKTREQYIFERVTDPPAWKRRLQKLEQEKQQKSEE